MGVVGGGGGYFTGSAILYGVRLGLSVNSKPYILNPTILEP